MSVSGKVGHPSASVIYPMANPANKKARDRYGKLFDDVSALLFRLDPIGINFDTNTDEYEPEARTILPRLSKCRSQADVLQVVLEEFHRWFGDDIRGDKVSYEQIAAAIWDLWSSRSE
jgi:hypothetical protein